MIPNIQIVIPMSGFGERFRKAGYDVPKPLIKVDGKPIIAHVIDMFPGESDFIFICNEEHLSQPKFNMREILQLYCPSGKIIGISAHKLGPAHAVKQIYNLLDFHRPIVVNYCDFTCYWDWKHFKKFILLSGCDGALPAYKGFHPHSLGNTNYAYIKANGTTVEDIQEKQPYTLNRMNEYASSGTYYFSSAALMAEAFDNIIADNLNVNGEFYVSMAYKYLLSKQMQVLVYPLQHFMQWGTPEDLREYKNWSDIFRYLLLPHDKNINLGASIIPLAGAGQRFVDEGYEKIKPLISVSGKPMVLRAHADLPKTSNNAFILRKDMKNVDEIKSAINTYLDTSHVIELDALTEGQACTSSEGLKGLRNLYSDEQIQPITFGACDNGMIFDNAKFKQLVDDDDVDVIVWGVRGHASAIRNPRMFGWIEQKDGIIQKISVKTPLSHPEKDPIVIGTFTFKKVNDFESTFNSLIKNNNRINNEFYLDSCINEALYLGLRCHYFEIKHFISWGTPNELRTFEYWQSCFHKWNTHPYCLEKDGNLDSRDICELGGKYGTIIPIIPSRLEHA